MHPKYHYNETIHVGGACNACSPDDWFLILSTSDKTGSESSITRSPEFIGGSPGCEAVHIVARVQHGGCYLSPQLYIHRGSWYVVHVALQVCFNSFYFSVLEKKSTIQEEFMKLCKTLRS